MNLPESEYKWVVENGVARPEPDLLEFCIFCECCQSRVRQSTVRDIRISTVFLLIAPIWFAEERPLIFETMIFGENIPALNEAQWRYATLDQAKRGHEIACLRVGEFCPDDPIETVDFNCGERLPGYEEKSAQIRSRWRPLI